MPKHNITNLGDLQAYVYLRGIITEIDSDNDTADVTIGDRSYSDALIYYHCDPDAVLRDNGAIEGGAAGFAVDDEVVIMARQTNPGEYERLWVVAHTDGIRKCQADWVRVKINGEGVEQTQLILMIVDDDDVSNIVVTDHEGYFKIPEGFSKESRLYLWAWGGDITRSMYENHDFSDGLTDWTVTGNASVEEDPGKILVGKRNPDIEVDPATSGLSQTHLVTYSGDVKGMQDNRIYCRSIQVYEISGSLSFGPLTITEPGVYSYFSCTVSEAALNRTHTISFSIGDHGYAVISTLTGWYTGRPWLVGGAVLPDMQFAQNYAIERDSVQNIKSTFMYWEQTYGAYYTGTNFGEWLFVIYRQPMDDQHPSCPLYGYQSGFWSPGTVPGSLSYSFVKKVQYTKLDTKISQMGIESRNIYGASRGCHVANFPLRYIKQSTNYVYDNDWCSRMHGGLYAGLTSSGDAAPGQVLPNWGRYVKIANLYFLESDWVMECGGSMYFCHIAAPSWAQAYAQIGLDSDLMFLVENCLIFSDANGQNVSFSGKQINEYVWTPEYDISELVEGEEDWFFVSHSTSLEETVLAKTQSFTLAETNKLPDVYLI